MDLLPSEEQQQIAEMADAYLGKEMPASRLRSAVVDGRGEVAALAAMGWLGVALPEAVGGSGMSLIEETLIFREGGRHLISPSALATALAASLALEAGEEKLAAAFAAGAPAAFCHPAGPAGSSDPLDRRWLLIDGEGADSGVVWTEAGLTLVSLAGSGDRQAAAGLDNALGYQGLRLGGCNVIARAGAGGAQVQRARVLAAALLLGMSQAVRDMAADYAKLREQFGKPIGAFQAIKHKCADMVLHSEAAQAQVMFAAAAVAGGRPDADFQSIAAKIIATQAAYLCARHNIQIHGAMGFTVECDAHWFMKRTHVLDQLGGSLRRQHHQLLQCNAPI